MICWKLYSRKSPAFASEHGTHEHPVSVDPVVHDLQDHLSWLSSGNGGKTLGKPQENGGLMGFNGIFGDVPSGND